jgi:branched-chain amino acid transport system permease protein
VTVLGYSLADLPTQLEPAKYERMVFGIILVLMMIFRPQGIFPARRRQRELAQVQTQKEQVAVAGAEP